MTLKKLAQLWHRFFFAPMRVETLSLYRIFFGFLMFRNALSLWPDVLTWYGPRGVMSLQTSLLERSSNWFNLFPWLPDTELTAKTILICATVAGMFLMLGLFSRLASVALFVLTTSLHSRNLMILNSGDHLLRIVAFFMMFLPVGAAYSLDSLLRTLGGGTPRRKRTFCPWPFRLIQIQICIVYLVTTLLKTQGAPWLDGNALYYAIHLDSFRKYVLPDFLLSPLMLKLQTWGTLLVEFSLGTLIWFKDLRYFLICAGVALHLGIEYTMDIPLFEWTMIFSLLLFVDPWDIKRSLRWIRLKVNRKFGPPLTVFYDGECAFCVRSIHFLGLADILGRVRWLNFRNLSPSERLSPDPERAEGELMLLIPEGTWLGGFDAFRALAWRLPLFWITAPFLYLPGARPLGSRTYRWIARNRTRIMVFT